MTDTETEMQHYKETIAKLKLEITRLENENSELRQMVKKNDVGPEEISTATN